MKTLNNLWRMVLVAVIALTAGTAAKAAEPVDFGEMKLGEVYTPTKYGKAQGYYVPEADGVLCVNIIQGAMGFQAYEDAEHTIEVPVKSHGYVSNGYAYYIDVVKDKTVYFYEDFVLSNESYSLSLDLPITTTGIWPNPETEPGFSMSAGGELQIAFNQPPAFGSCFIYVNGHNEPITGSGAYVRNSYIHMDVYSPVQRLVNSGVMNYGDEFTIGFTDVHSQNDPKNLYNGDGMLALKYKLMDKPIEILGFKEINQPFLSYYLPGSQAAKFEMEFSAPIDVNRVKVTLHYGDLDNALTGGYYLEDIVPTFNEDNTKLYVDFSDKLRRSVDMLTNGNTYDAITFVVGNLRGLDGQYVNQREVGSYGTKTFNWRYMEVESDIVAEFTPRSGSSLENRSSIEIYVKNYDQLHHNGVKFEWPEDKVIIPVSELKLEKDQDGTAVTVTVPEAAKTARNVTVSFADMATPDGIDHSTALSARYNVAFSLQGNKCDPRSGSKLNRLAEGSVVTMSIDKPEGLGFVLLTVADKADLENPVLDRLELTGEGNLFKGTLPESLFFYSGHTYRFTVAAYASAEAYEAGQEAIGTDFIEYDGERTAFIPSTSELVSIVPDNGTELESVSQNAFVVTFDTFSNVLSSSYMLSNGERFQPVITMTGDTDTDDETGKTYCQEFTLTFSEEQLLAMDRKVTLVLFCTGQEDAVIVGNAGGEGENSHFEFDYILTYNSGVDNIAADEADEAEAVYYNLNGVRVDRATAAPGIYVRRAGDKATKVVIR